MAIYYAGLTHLRMNNPQQAMQDVENAIATWQLLDEEPPQLAEAHELLNSLKPDWIGS